MKDDKVECQKVIRLIEKYFKEDKGNLSYDTYCFYWKAVLDEVIE